MEQKTNKIQVYLDEQTHQKIQVLAKNDSISVSKYVARVLENHTELGIDMALFQVKTQAILAQILGSVYDYDLVNTNADEIKALLEKIDAKAKEKLAAQAV